MKKTLLLSLALFCLAPMLLGQKQAPPFATTTSLLVQNPRIENLDNPIGLDVTQPRFGWQLAADRRNVLQTAYQIQVANSPADLAGGKKLVWRPRARIAGLRADFDMRGSARAPRR